MSIHLQDGTTITLQLYGERQSLNLCQYFRLSGNLKGVEGQPIHVCWKLEQAIIPQEVLTADSVEPGR
jgi:hypothetical protein